MNTEQVLQNRNNFYKAQNYQHNKLGVEAIIEGREVKSSGTSGHIMVPRKYLGRKVIVIVLSEDERNKNINQD